MSDINNKRGDKMAQDNKPNKKEWKDMSKAERVLALFILAVLPFIVIGVISAVAGGNNDKTPETKPQANQQQSTDNKPEPTSKVYADKLKKNMSIVSSSKVSKTGINGKKIEHKEFKDAYNFSVGYWVKLDNDIYTRVSIYDYDSVDKAEKAASDFFDEAKKRDTVYSVFRKDKTVIRMHPIVLSDGTVDEVMELLDLKAQND